MSTVVIMGITRSTYFILVQETLGKTKVLGTSLLPNGPRREKRIEKFFLDPRNYELKFLTKLSTHHIIGFFFGFPSFKVGINIY